MSASLFKRSGLNFVSNILDTFLKLIAGLVVTPIVANSLGVRLYGVWSILMQLFGYISLANLNAASTLKIRLAVLQHDTDPLPKQRLLGAAYQLFKYSTLITVVAVAISISFAPIIFKDSKDVMLSIYLAIFIGAISILIEQYGGIAGNALRGNNLDYKGMGYKSIALLLSNIALVIFAYYKTGLIGMAIAMVVNALTFTFIWKILAKKNLPWFKPVPPNTADLKSYGKQSGLTLAYSIGNLMLNSFDGILIGLVFNSTKAAVYFASLSLFRSLLLPIISNFIASSNTGIAYLCTANDPERLKKVLFELLQVTLVLFIGAGIFFILFNKLFMLYWIGEAFYNIQHLEFLFVLFCFSHLLFTINLSLLDGFQMFKQKALVTIIMSISYLLMNIFLLPLIGMSFLLISGIIVRLVALVISQVLLQSKLNCITQILTRQFMYSALLVIILLPVYYLFLYLNNSEVVSVWVVLFITVLVLSIFMFFALPAVFKQRLIAVYKKNGK